MPRLSNEISRQESQTSLSSISDASSDGIKLMDPRRGDYLADVDRSYRELVEAVDDMKKKTMESALPFVDFRAPAALLTLLQSYTQLDPVHTGGAAAAPLVVGETPEQRAEMEHFAVLTLLSRVFHTMIDNGAPRCDIRIYVTEASPPEQRWFSATCTRPSFLSQIKPYLHGEFKVALETTHEFHRAVAVLPEARAYGLFPRKLRIHQISSKHNNVFLLHYEHPVLARPPTERGAGVPAPDDDATSAHPTHYFIVEEPDGTLRRDPVPADSIYAKPALLYISDDRAIQRLFGMWGTSSNLALIDAIGTPLVTFVACMCENFQPLAADLEHGVLYTKMSASPSLFCFDLRTGSHMYGKSPNVGSVLDVVVVGPNLNVQATKPEHGAVAYILHVPNSSHALQHVHLAKCAWDSFDAQLRIISVVNLSFSFPGYDAGLAKCVIGLSGCCTFMSSRGNGSVTVAQWDGESIQKRTREIPERATSMVLTNSGRLLFTLGQPDTTLYTMQLHVHP